MKQKLRETTTIKGGIRKEEIRELRDSMYIGKEIDSYIKLNSMGERLRVPKRIHRYVCGIYPHLVQLCGKEGKKDTPVETVTYVELLLREKGEQSHV